LPIENAQLDRFAKDPHQGHERSAMLTENGQLAGAHEQYRPLRAKAFWQMVLCTPTCEREGDVRTINRLGVTRLALAVCQLPRCDTGTARGYV
jgi:hypothetical protein